MKRALLTVGSLLLAAGAAVPQGAAQERGGYERGGPAGRGRMAYANPSEVIATEIAFAQLAQEKGQWTAFAYFAAPDAVMFAPGMVYAQGWLKGRANPPAAVKWQPHAVWSSCDGSLAVSHGAWQAGKENGWFTTIWQRQPDGTYRWVLDHGDSLAAPLAAPDMLAGLVADCPDRPHRGEGPPPARDGKSRGNKPPKVDKNAPLPPLDPAQRNGRSGDGTLSWAIAVGPDNARHLTVTWKKDGQDQTALDDRAAAGH